MCFSASVGHHFLNSENVGRHFCPDFQGFFRISTNQNFWGYAFTPALPPPTPFPLEKTLLALAWKKSFQRQSRGTCSSTEMLKGYMARESLGTPALGSDYGYAWPDAIQIKGSVCHSKCPGSWSLGVMCCGCYAKWFSVQLSPTLPCYLYGLGLGLRLIFYV